MFTAKFDTFSDLQLNLPPKHKPFEIVLSTRSYLDYELSRPPEEQLPQTPRLIELYDQWNASDEDRSEGESQRAEAAEEVEQLDQALTRCVRHIRKTIDAAYPHSPAKAKSWGFPSKNSTKNILLPRNRQEHLKLLDKYISKEQSRPEEERFTSPPLAEVIEIRDKLQRQLKVRSLARAQREDGVTISNAIALEMYNQLQGAVVYLLNFRFNFKLTVKLEKWGFEIVTRRNAAEEEEEDAPVEAADPAAPADAAATEPAPETTTSTNGSPTNGTYTNGAQTNGATTNGSQPDDGGLVSNLLANDGE